MKYPKTPKPVTGEKLEKYLLEHARPTKQNGFWRVHKKLRVFKKVYDGVVGPCIANLVLPVGTLIYVSPYAFAYQHRGHRKMRADQAYVHSIASVSGRTPVCTAYSAHNSMFEYAPGKTIRPEYPFSMNHETCASGIHFFLNLRDAVEY